MRKIVIAGANSAIGKAIFNEIKDENDVITISRSDFPESPDHFIGNALGDDLPEINESIDGLVYCPGHINLRPFPSLKDDDFKTDLEINLFGAVRTIRKYIKNLKKGNNPSVVLFSTVAVQQGMPFHASIAAAKGAVEALARSLAAEYASAVRFNVVAPSLTDTPMAEKLLRNEKQREASANRHPMKRIGDPKDIARLAAFLLSDNSSWITGQTLHVDGGLSTLKV